MEEEIKKLEIDAENQRKKMQVSIAVKDFVGLLRNQAVAPTKTKQSSKRRKSKRE